MTSDTDLHDLIHAARERGAIVRVVRDYYTETSEDAILFQFRVKEASQ